MWAGNSRVMTLVIWNRYFLLYGRFGIGTRHAPRTRFSKIFLGIYAGGETPAWRLKSIMGSFEVDEGFIEVTGHRFRRTVRLNRTVGQRN